jgi:hypothetical protein
MRRLRRSDKDNPPSLASTAARIRTIMFANGADNMSVVVPPLRALHCAGSQLATGLFLVLVGSGKHSGRYWEVTEPWSRRWVASATGRRWRWSSPSASSS